MNKSETACGTAATDAKAAATAAAAMLASINKIAFSSLQTYQAIVDAVANPTTPA